MKEEDIEKAAAKYSGKALGYNGAPVIAMHEAFRDGANWRINSAWNEGKVFPAKGNIILIEFESGAILIGGPCMSEKGYNDLCGKIPVKRWAYIDDLLPKNEISMMRVNITT